jgi:RNA recognition motif-containing protein
LKRARLFVGNLTTDSVSRRDLAELFTQYGRVLGVSIHGGFAFVQMDRERDANRAIICEDGQTFKGSKIHVEFSQAAKEAGARRAQHQNPSPPPVRERERDYGPPPPPPPPPRIDDYRASHDDRLERVLLMEREMAYLQAREDIYSEMLTRSQPDPPPSSSYDRHREDSYRRPPLSPPPPSNPYPSSRDRDYPTDRSDRGGGPDDRRPYYSRSESSGMSYSQGHDSRSDQLLSYPLPRNRTGNGHRGAAELLAGAYGGAATSGKSVGYGSGGGYSSSKSAASGGYSLGKSSSGWSSHDYPRGGGGSGGRSGPYSGPSSGGGSYWN